MRRGYRPRVASHETGVSSRTARSKSVGPRDGAEDDCAVLRVTAHRPDLVERAAGRHHAGATHASERRPQPDEAAADGGREDRSAGVGADRKSDEPRGGRGARTRRRSARPLLQVPRIVRPSAGPLIAKGELARCQLGDEHGPRRRQPLHDRRIVRKRLLREWRRAPRGWIAFRRDDVLHAVRDAVQHAAIAAGGDLAIGRARFGQRALLGQRGDAVQLRVESLQPPEIHRRQLDRRGLTRAEQLREVRDRPEGDGL